MDAKPIKYNHHLFSFCCTFTFFLALIINPSSVLKAQEDSLPKIEHQLVRNSFPDSIFQFFVKKPNPKRAGLYSACLPGLGQLYNKQYWKVGLVYTGVAVATGFLISNYSEYNKYRKIYIGMIDNNPATPNTYENYTIEDVKFLRDGFRRFLEYTIIGSSVGYLLNILDAYISAHLKSFDMSKDLSLNISPLLNEFKQPALKLSFCIAK